MRFAAVIAAAGLSSRMHAFKPMMCLGRTTFISRVIESFREGGVETIVVVTGYRSSTLEEHLRGENIILCENPEFASTKMFDSLCLGLRALPGMFDGVFLAPGDVPLVQGDTIRKIAESGARIARPVYDGVIGHPTYFCGSCIPSLLDYSGKDGLRGAIQSLGFPVTDISVSDPGITMDGDTREDVRHLRRQEQKNRNGGELWMDLDIQIGRGDTVLKPESVQLLEMVGATGSIQSACSCMHMSYTKGWRLLNDMEKGLGVPLTERAAGGSEGGSTTLTKAGALLVQRYNLFCTELRREAESRFQSVFPSNFYEE